jgi:hypothetical protein
VKFFEAERTWISQLGKPQNRAMLEAYKARKDRSIEEFIKYYIDVINALINTPAWGVSGVNKMINELTDAVRATINYAKNGKTSAPAHANKLLSIIDFYHNEEAIARYCGRYKLKPLITEEELQQFLAA